MAYKKLIYIAEQALASKYPATTLTAPAMDFEGRSRFATYNENLTATLPTAA